MSDTYDTDDLADDRSDPVALTRVCDGRIGCGRDLTITVEPDGTYDGGVFIGTVDVPTDDAHVVGETFEEDEWFGTMSNVEWSETVEEEVWLHEECAKPTDVDPDEVDRTVA